MCKKLLLVLTLSVFLSSHATGKALEAEQFLSSVYDQIVTSSNELSVKYAVIDLQRYLAQVNKNKPAVREFTAWQQKSESAIVVAGIDKIAEYLEQKVSDIDLGEEGYLIKKVNVDGQYAILLGANTSVGKVNAVYGFLETLGYQFYLGSEYVPSSLPDSFTDETIVKKPALEVRGTLPWYNFFNSPTTWNSIDHRAYVDQLVRSGANFITFHSYDTEPFSGYEENGEMVHSSPLNHSGKETWGTNFMKTEDFFFGTNKLFDTEYFGAKTTLAGYDWDTQIKKERGIFRDALSYAKDRGLKTSFGFSIAGDPTLKEDRERFIRQLEENLKYYDDTLDYIFLWQRETKGAQGHPFQYQQHILPHPRKADSKIIDYGNYRRNIFKRVVEEGKGVDHFYQQNEEGKTARAVEGARLEMFGELALRVLDRYESTPEIVISGWGGETYLMSADYYEGLDQVLSPEVSFSSLDHIQPQPSVDKIYSDLPEERQRWPIPWLENDGDQWHPQPYVHLFESTGNNILESGSQGFLSIHWRTREVEENFGYLTNLAWNPDLTAEDFFAKKSNRFEEPEVAEQVKDILISLDKLGYRWVGGHGQNECAVFTWGSGENDKLVELREIKDSLESLNQNKGIESSYLSWINNRMEWVIKYYKAETKAEEAERLMENAERAEGDEKMNYAQKAYGILSGDELADAMQSYAKRMTTRGEYGVMATINTKAAYDWNQMYQKAQQILHVEQKDLSYKWTPETEIIVPRFYGSAEADKPLEIKAIVLGGKPAILKYRQPGDNIWKEKKMKVTNGWVNSVVIDSDIVQKPGLEYAISVENSDKEYGPKAITIFPSNSDQTRNLVKSADSGSDDFIGSVNISFEEDYTVFSWEDIT